MDIKQLLAEQNAARDAARLASPSVQRFKQRLRDDAALIIMAQIATLTEAITTLQNAIDEVTGEVDPEAATWRDVSRLAMLVDAVKRAGLT